MKTRKTVREMKAELKQAQREAVIDLRNFMLNKGTHMTAAEITRELDDMNIQQVVGVLRANLANGYGYRKSINALQSHAHMENTGVNIGSQRIVRRFAEIGEHGDLLENGRVICTTRRVNTYSLVEK